MVRTGIVGVATALVALGRALDALTDEERELIRSELADVNAALTRLTDRMELVVDVA